MDCSTCSTCNSQGICKKFEPKYNSLEYNEDFKHPYAAIMSITDNCTHACPYCFVNFGTKRMSLETARQSCKYIIENAKYHNVSPQITFFGGEPLLEFNSIIVPIVEEFSEICFSITTNGLLLTQDVVDFFCEHHIAVLLSFDGDKTTQDISRPLKNGESSFDLTLKNIPYAIEKLGANISMRSTLTKDNAKYLYENFCFANNLGFNTWSFAINEYDEYGADDEKIIFQQIDYICHDISIALNSNKNIIKCQPIGTYFNKLYDNELNFQYEVDNGVFRCGMSTTGTGISCEGLIIPCQEKNSKIGNAIGDIYNGIDSEKHLKYLTDYISKMTNWHCSKLCSDKIKRICLNDCCPSRIEDLKSLNPSSGKCVLTRALHLYVARLFLQFSNSANPYIREYYFLADREVDRYNDKTCS